MSRGGWRGSLSRVEIVELAERLGAWGCDGSWVITPSPMQGRYSRTWTVSIGDRITHVAKLIFDGRRYAEPGLRIAADLAGLSIATGPPIHTRSGELALDVADGEDRPCTLALLRYERGRPLARDARKAAGVAGGLLGRVHAALAVFPCSRVPGRVIDWYQQQATAFGGEAVRGAEHVRDLWVAGKLHCSIIYGDPSPEVLIAGHATALIDWGTPSWGPVLHDIAVWTSHFGASHAQPQRQAEFLDAYREQAGISTTELRHLPALVDLLHRLKLFGGP